jgi:hypothetical protein
MSHRPLSVGELAVHFGLEPIDIEWLLYRHAAGISRPELIQDIQELNCARTEAERLATHISQSAALYGATLSSQFTAGPSHSYSHPD